jgi:hypothetical protein
MDREACKAVVDGSRQAGNIRLGHGNWLLRRRSGKRGRKERKKQKEKDDTM